MVDFAKRHPSLVAWVERTLCAWTAQILPAIGFMNTTNLNAYLVYLGTGNYTSNQQFMNAFNGVKSKTDIPGLNNAYVVWSDLDLNQWYSYFGNVGQTGAVTGAVSMPLIIPIDTDVLSGVKNLPEFLRSFTQHSVAA